MSALSTVPRRVRGTWVNIALGKRFAMALSFDHSLNAVIFLAAPFMMKGLPQPAAYLVKNSDAFGMSPSFLICGEGRQWCS